MPEIRVGPTFAQTLVSPFSPIGPQELALRRACGRLLHVDDMLRINVYRRLLESQQAPDPAQLSPREQRLLRMLVGSLVSGAVSKDTPLGEGAALLWSHPQVRAELLDLLEVLAARIEHVPVPLSTHLDVPLEVHARYTRVEILAAFDVGEGAKVAPWQTGVYWASNARADLFAFTLDKTTGQFSPTTRYRDYAISPDLIHWESQSVTRADSETGRRYQRHAAMGTSVMLFARHRSDERAFYFLGPATYVKHESELPMAITWRLRASAAGGPLCGICCRRSLELRSWMTYENLGRCHGQGLVSVPEPESIRTRSISGNPAGRECFARCSPASHFSLSSIVPTILSWAAGISFAIRRCRLRWLGTLSGRRMESARLRSSMPGSDAIVETMRPSIP